MSRHDPLVSTLPLSRRSFVVRSGAVAVGVAFGTLRPVAQGTAAIDDANIAGTTARLAPNPWVTLRTDGTIEIVAPGIEMGQGTLSTLPRYVAEELDADWNQVRIVWAPADEKTYGNPFFWGIQITAGSRTCLGYFELLRIAGAQARYVLLQTAARKWQVPAGDLSTSSSTVLHAPSRRRLAYAELVADAVVPEEFPDFVAPDGRAQEFDDFFGEPASLRLPPSTTRPPPVALKSMRDFKLLGVDAPRVDVPDKVNGAARFGIDFEVPDMVVALVATGPRIGTVPDKVDAAAARAVPGVLDVIQLPHGVAVVANDVDVARKARERLAVSWTSGADVSDYDSDATLEDFMRIARDAAREPGVRAYEQGDPQEALAILTAQTPVVFEARSELVYHAPLEPQNAIVSVAADGASAEAWVGTQWPMLDKAAIATVIGTDPANVKVHPLLVGGSFGRRQEPGAVVDAAHISKRMGRPVKVIWMREEDLRRNPHRQAVAIRIEAALAADGRITAMRSRIVGDSWFARMFPDFFKQYNEADPGNWVGARHPYDVPLQLIDCVTARRSVDVCYLRGIGCTQAKFALESIVDEIAVRGGQDPLQYRLEMLRAAPRAQRVLREVASMSDWPRRRPGRALGVAYAGYGNAHAALVADVSVDRKNGRIRVHEAWSAVDVGFAVQPDIVRSQMEGGIVQGLSMALHEQVTYRNGAAVESNFNDYRILRMSETPEITVEVLSTDNAVSGVAEIGVMPIAPAVNNALAVLIGRRLDRMPMKPELVLATLRA
jgi:isoquinoline 1-oxidoreductase beta subunit